MAFVRATVLPARGIAGGDIYDAIIIFYAPAASLITNTLRLFRDIIRPGTNGINNTHAPPGELRGNKRRAKGVNLRSCVSRFSGKGSGGHGRRKNRRRCTEFYGDDLINASPLTPYPSPPPVPRTFRYALTAIRFTFYSRDPIN